MHLMTVRILIFIALAFTSFSLFAQVSPRISSSLDSSKTMGSGKPRLIFQLEHESGGELKMNEWNGNRPRLQPESVGHENPILSFGA